MDPIFPRLLLFILGLLCSGVTFSNAPWTSQDPSMAWAMVHAGSYFVLGACVLICPWQKLVGLVCIVAAAWLPLTYVLAFRQWPGGNDGGGFFWILVVFPMCFISFVSYLAAAASLISSIATDDASELRNSWPRHINLQAYHVDVTAEAAEEIGKRRAKQRICRDAAVRIIPIKSSEKCLVQFDLPEFGKVQWRGVSHDIPILVDESDLVRLSGSVIDFREGDFMLNIE